MNLTDSHLHFDSFAEKGEVDDILRRAAEAGVRRMVAIGGSVDANQLAVSLAEKHPGRVYATVGYDRDEAGQNPPLDKAEELIGQSGVVGVGETGLDYHYSSDTADSQKELFGQMLDLAAVHQLPVVVHSREADEDMEAMLSNHVERWTGAADGIGVLHCYTAGLGFAKRLLNLGMYISFSGIVTFKNAAALREVAAAVPGDRLLIETDAPYLAPPPHRGKRNEPAYVEYVAKVVAEVRGCTVQEVAAITSDNAARLFGWPEEQA